MCALEEAEKVNVSKCIYSLLCLCVCSFGLRVAWPFCSTLLGRLRDSSSSACLQLYANSLILSHVFIRLTQVFNRMAKLSSSSCQATPISILHRPFLQQTFNYCTAAYHGLNFFFFFYPVFYLIIKCIIA